LSKIRRLAAWSLDISEESLFRLKRDDDEYVADVALNLRSTSNDLSFCSYNAILERIKANEINEYDLDILGTSLNKEVVLAVVQCSLTSKNTLTKLSDSSETQIREIALTRLGHKIRTWRLRPTDVTCKLRQTTVNRPSLFVAVLSPGGVYYSPENLQSLISEHNLEENGPLDDLDTWIVCKPPSFEIKHLSSGKSLLELPINSQRRIIIDTDSLRKADYLATACLSISSHLDCIFSIETSSSSFSQLPCDKDTLIEFIDSAPIGSFIELIEFRDQKSSELSVYGMGVEIDVFELTKEQYETINQTRDFDYVDSPEWDLDDIGQYSLAEDFSVYYNDEEVDIKYNFNKDAPQAMGTIKYSSRTDRLTEPGKFYAIRAWENKGRWYGCQFDGFFRPRCLNIEKIYVQLGADDHATTIELYGFHYEGVTSLLDCSSNGKGVARYLVNDLGEVSEI